MRFAWPFSRGKIRRDVPVWDLSAPLLGWSKRDRWTLRDALEGCLVLGATGSGKSSGSARTMARMMLQMLMGGLVLTAKSDERGIWESYCKQIGRLDDLIVIRPDLPWRFNFLDYELNRKGSGAGHTENIVNLLSAVLEVAERSQQSGAGREDESYWRRASRQLTRNLVDLLVLATGRVSVPELYRLVVSAPMSIEQLHSETWRRKSFCFECLSAAEKRQKNSQQEHDFALLADYFLLEFPALSDKTRSVIVSTFTSLVDVLNRGALRDLFCTETNVTPEDVAAGKIIVLDLPVKEYGEVGLIAQVLFKYAFQRSIERRDVEANPRPVFLWADEAQHFVTSYDMQFQTTCRAARVATVMISQNVSNFYAALGGGDMGRSEADSLFGNLNTKIFHANGDPVTNDWAASLIGRTKQFFVNASSSYSDEANWMNQFLGLRSNQQNSAGISESYEFDLQPREFTRLRTGGPQFGWNVDGIVFQNGRVFAESGRNWLGVTFKQRS